MSVVFNLPGGVARDAKEFRCVGMSRERRDESPEPDEMKQIDWSVLRPNGPCVPIARGNAPGTDGPEKIRGLKGRPFSANEDGRPFRPQTNNRIVNQGYGNDRPVGPQERLC